MSGSISIVQPWRSRGPPTLSNLALFISILPSHNYRVQKPRPLAGVDPILELVVVFYGLLGVCLGFVEPSPSILQWTR